MEQQPEISVRNVTIGYNKKPILHDISFDIHAGEIVTILGGSGCGKSTLLKTMIGLIPVLSGDILIEGDSIVKAAGEEKKKIMRKFGTAFQGGALFRSYTLAENVALPLEEYTTLSKEEIQKRVEDKLAMVGLAGFGDYFPGSLSGGMLKRGAVARALALDQKIIFLDEPSAGLDPVTSANLDQLLLQIRDRYHAALVLVTHELESIFTIADRAIFLDNQTGTILASGSPEELRTECPYERVRVFLNRARQKKEIESCSMINSK